LEGLERWAVTKADHVVVVSEQLKEYLSDRYRISSPRISIIPCCADASMFKWDIERRQAQRHALELADRFICTHLGSFFEWYEPELLLTLFAQIRTHVPNAHLLVVTGATERAREYIAQHLPAGSFTVMSAKHDEVAPLLNASDLGFLLLRSSPNIKTSSPAKFSEYLNCGLPVLITPDVGDFSDLIRRTGTGLVVTCETVIDAGFLSNVQSSRNDLALRCVEAGRHLTWQAYAALSREILGGII
jgi:glycosyltransferase involved in cell wall biosynthesis